MSETGPKAKGQKTKITILPIRDKIAVAIVLLFISAILWLVSIHLCEYRRRIKCGEKLSHLGKAMIISAGYCDDKYPVPDKWCDVLVKYAEVTKDEFVCPAAGKSRCDYAMNPDATLTSVPDIVVLFESKPGWNQFGGSELLNFENHDGKGGNVLFNDLHVKFVKTRDLANLMWNPDQINKRHLNITKAKLKIVHSALMQFKLDTGRFPTEQEGLIALIKLPGDVKNTAEHGGYLETIQNLKDGWGNDFHYELYPESGKPFVIISYGADGKEGGEGYDADWPERMRKPKDY